jgi:hypothetical protein
MLDKTNLDEAGVKLMEGAEYIRTNGWCQHALWKPTGEVCALGALTKVRAPSESYFRLQYLVDPTAHTIALWNNAPERTKEQVIEALETAAFMK